MSPTPNPPNPSLAPTPPARRTGPRATQILGDYGADVIKVEPPEGDLMRANGATRTRGMSSIFLAINRNKRSLAIDLKRPEDLAALKHLLPTVDVLVHNMRRAAIDRLGLGYAACGLVLANAVLAALLEAGLFAAEVQALGVNKTLVMPTPEA